MPIVDIVQVSLRIPHFYSVRHLIIFFQLLVLMVIFFYGFYDGKSPLFHQHFGESLLFYGAS